MATDVAICVFQCINEAQRRLRRVLTHGLRDFVLLERARREGEVFALILLNSRDRFIEYVELFHGTDAVEVKAQPLLERILQHKASQVIFVHNHVSGRCTPSVSDLMLTDRWRKALSLFNG